MTTPMTTLADTDRAPAQRMERVAAALTERRFGVEIVDDAAAARVRVHERALSVREAIEL